MPPTQWRLLPREEAAAQQLHEQLRIAPLLCQLLVQRGIRTYDQARLFFRPSFDDLHSPFLMAGMEGAVERLD